MWIYHAKFDRSRSNGSISIAFRDLPEELGRSRSLIIEDYTDQLHMTFYE